MFRTRKWHRLKESCQHLLWLHGKMVIGSRVALGGELVLLHSHRSEEGGCGCGERD